MGTTTNYGYNVPVGSDNVNLLPDMSANFPMIDSDLKAVSNTGVGTATELVTGTVHALTRADRDRNVFKFVATSNFEAGETFEVDGVQVTAKTPDGRNLSTGAYVINSTVLCMLEGTLLTVLVNPAKALDSENLDGHPATYFATAAALSALDNQLGAVSSKVGTGVLDVGNDCVDGINVLNIQLTNVGRKLIFGGSATPNQLVAEFNSTASASADWYIDYMLHDTGGMAMMIRFYRFPAISGKKAELFFKANESASWESVWTIN